MDVRSISESVNSTLEEDIRRKENVQPTKLETGVPQRPHNWGATSVDDSLYKTS